MTKINWKYIFHPWEYLRDELDARKWTQKEFAQIIWKSPKEVYELINWKINITPNWAILIATAFNTSEEVWLNLQMKYDLQISKSKINIKKIREIKSKVLVYS